MNNKDRFRYNVLPHETDMCRKMTPYNIGSFALDCAGEAANARGFSMRYLQEHGFTWVISRISVEMTEYPEEFTMMDIDTWVASVSKVASNRNFHIYNNNGEQVGKVTSLWSVIDFRTRKLSNLLDCFPDMEKHIHQDDTPFSLKAERIDIPHSEPRIQAYHTVAYSDIDMNRHTNSMKYMQWVLDLIDVDVLENLRIARFDINFINETVYGDTVSIAGYAQHEHEYVFILKKDDAICCKIKLIFDK